MQPTSFWVPDRETIARSQMTQFVGYCAERTGRRFEGPGDFHEFSVSDFRNFWRLFLQWVGLPYQGNPDRVCTSDDCERAFFFPDLRLNYADILLRIAPPDDAAQLALTACDGYGRRQQFTRGELRGQVSSIREGLRALGVQAGDRVAAVAGNDAEAVLACLAVVSLGAAFSSAAPEMGVSATVSRFEQLEPSFLVCRSSKGHEAVPLPGAERIAEIAALLPSVKAIVELGDRPMAQVLKVPVVHLAALRAHRPTIGEWEHFPFNHPLFILFSSGTTGKPKCIVHGAGGTLIEHLKEHRLHCDLRRGDRLYFHTSCGWMMWNWQLSALASGTHIILYDGATGPETLWALAAQEKVSVLGTSPAYLQMCDGAGFVPQTHFNLAALRSILSTGSILYDRQYDWVRDNVKAVPLQSISGGTDIVGCFVLGNPNLAVYRGEAQCRSLAYDVQSQLPPNATPGHRVGELVCRNPFPSRPLGLYGDHDGTRFHSTYFAQNQGMWTHGDFIEFTDRGTARLHGRSDGVLNIRGVRIGPAEIYQVVQAIPGIVDVMAVEQKLPAAPGGSRMVLLVVLQKDARLDGPMIHRIRTELGRRGSAAHVPGVIIDVPALPTTHSGKRSECAAHDAINHLPIRNLEALKNADCLSAISAHPALSRVPDDRVALRGAFSPHDTLERKLQKVWERLFDIAPIGIDDNFFELGGHSLLALSLLTEVRKLTGREFMLSVLLVAPTIASLAAMIRMQAGATASCLVPVKSNGSGNPLFVVHGIYGNVLDLKRLADRLCTVRPIYALQAVGLDGKQRPYSVIEDMADHYIGEIRKLQPSGPYALAGHSFGGLVAFEIARRLNHAGERIELVALFDTDVHERNLPLRQWLQFQAGRVTRVCSKTVRRGAGLAYLRDVISERLLGRLGLRMPPHPLASIDLPQHFVAVHAANIRAMRAYRPKGYPGHVCFFRSELRQPQRCDPLPVWRRVSLAVSVYHVSGGHLTMMDEPHVTLVAQHLDHCLTTPGAAARSTAPGIRMQSGPLFGTS